MPWYVLALFLLIGGAGLYNSVKALRNLSPDHKKDIWRVIMLGPFATREYFTLEGWHYRNRGLWLPLIAFLLSIFLWIISEGM